MVRRTPWGGLNFLILWLGSIFAVFAFLQDRVYWIAAFGVAVLWSVLFPLLLSYWTWLWRLFSNEPASEAAGSPPSYEYHPRTIELTKPLAPITTLPLHFGEVYGATETYDQERGWIFRTDWYYFTDRSGLFLVLRDEELQVLDERFLLAGRWLIDTELLDAHALSTRCVGAELAKRATVLSERLAMRKGPSRRVHSDVVAYSRVTRYGPFAIPEYLLSGKIDSDALAEALRSALPQRIEISPNVPRTVTRDLLARWLEYLPVYVSINGETCPGVVLLADVNYGLLADPKDGSRPSPWATDRQTLSIDAWEFDDTASLVARNYTWVAGKGWYRTADYYR
jgi:hypothetical protein